MKIPVGFPGRIEFRDFDIPAEFELHLNHHGLPEIISSLVIGCFSLPLNDDYEPFLTEGFDLACFDMSDHIKLRIRWIVREQFTEDNPTDGLPF